MAQSILLLSRRIMPCDNGEPGMKSSFCAPEPPQESVPYLCCWLQVEGRMEGVGLGWECVQAGL